ncbi:uncharacterized protein LOC128963497 [Oppia nitens]|uniref:uncharacterized protein LOC128963497 n=1 Tax=Oppia nitens TaxID=1686743 RepID=UPI0023DA0AEC|nr:uncharacterized protein LOC128963497 [Oppia nitens]
MLTQSEARDLCKSEDLRNNRTIDLLSIHSIEEQNFVNDYLTKLNVEDTVWLDLMRLDKDGKEFNSFVTTDGEQPLFENWAINKPTGDVKKRCVQMRGPIELKDKNTVETNVESKMFSIGKWEDVVCYKKNTILCQKFVEWDSLTLQKTILKTKNQLNYLSKAYNDIRLRAGDLNQQKLKLIEDDLRAFDEKNHFLESKLEVINNKTDVALRDMAANEYYIREIIDNPVPIGFVYVQLPGQPEPGVIWPTLQWTNISSEYSGLFFRVIGNDSEPFETIQTDHSPRIAAIVTQVKPKPGITRNYNEQIRPNDKWSPPLYTGSDGGDNNYYISFKMFSGEVRPKNTAIYIWKRTK